MRPQEQEARFVMRKRAGPPGGSIMAVFAFGAESVFMRIDMACYAFRGDTAVGYGILVAVLAGQYRMRAF